MFWLEHFHVSETEGPDQHMASDLCLGHLEDTMKQMIINKQDINNFIVQMLISAILAASTADHFFYVVMTGYIINLDVKTSNLCYQ